MCFRAWISSTTLASLSKNSSTDSPFLCSTTSTISITQPYKWSRESMSAVVRCAHCTFHVGVIVRITHSMATPSRLGGAYSRPRFRRVGHPRRLPLPPSSTPPPLWAPPFCGCCWWGFTLPTILTHGPYTGRQEPVAWEVIREGAPGE